MHGPRCAWPWRALLRHVLCVSRARYACPVSQPAIDESSEDFFDGYVQTDPVTGESKSLMLDEKEKLYLECLDAYYNENGKQILGDAEYEQLKLDIDFQGSTISTLSKDEIVFVLANKRFKMGKPVLDDAAYDALRTKLKKAGSNVVLHQGPTCNVETGVCKTDLKVDQGKQRLLYLPGTAGGLILSCELIYWTVGLDPILSVILGAIPSYFFGVWFTENVFAQKPLVTSGTCPDCQCAPRTPPTPNAHASARAAGVHAHVQPAQEAALTLLRVPCPRQTNKTSILATCSA